MQDVFLLVQLRDLPLRQELPRLLVDRGRNLLRERMHLRRRSRVWLLTAAASGGVGPGERRQQTPGLRDEQAGGVAAQVANGSVEVGEGRRNRTLGAGQSLKAGGGSVRRDGSGAAGNVADEGEALEDMPVASL